jgi:thymidylate synthase (FAD)
MMGRELIDTKGGEVIRRRLAGEDVTQETSRMSKGEWWEFKTVLGVQEISKE